MRVYFAHYVSHEIMGKFRAVMDIQKELDLFFASKSYGDDVDFIDIGVHCMNPVFESSFPPKKPKYNRIGKKHPYDDSSNKAEDKVLTFELRLDHKKYMEITDIRSVFPQDVLNSLDVISTIKQIKDFDLAKFKSDFEAFFKLIGWISPITC